MKCKGISLFSGCGGLDLGFEMVNDLLNNIHNEDIDKIFEIIWANDIDESAVETYKLNFKIDKYINPDDKNVEGKIFCGDVRQVKFNEVLDKDIVDFVLGGFPCQDFSILRGGKKRKGIHVERGQLYVEYVRSLIELQPIFFVAENVKGLKSANNGYAFEQICNDFEHLTENWEEIREKSNFKYDIPVDTKNYTILFKEVVNFSHYNVPQNRERLIIIGIRSDYAEKIGNIEKIKFDIGMSLKTEHNIPLTPMEVLEGKLLNDESLDKRYHEVMTKYKDDIDKTNSERAEEFKKEVWNTYSFKILDDYIRLNNLEYTSEDLIHKIVITEHYKALEEIGASKGSIDKEEFEDNSAVLSNSHTRVKKRLEKIPPGENHHFVKGTKYSVKGLMSNIYRRLHPLVPSPTIIANGGGGTYGYHYRHERQELTNREKARLQTFPDNFKFTGNKTDIRRQIGNSVPPLGSKRIALTIKEIIIPEVERIKCREKGNKRVTV